MNERLVANAFRRLYNGDAPGPHALVRFSDAVDAVAAALADEWRAYGKQGGGELCDWAARITTELNR